MMNQTFTTAAAIIAVHPQSPVMHFIIVAVAFECHPDDAQHKLNNVVQSAFSHKIEPGTYVIILYFGVINCKRLRRAHKTQILQVFVEFSWNLGAPDPRRDLQTLLLVCCGYWILQREKKKRKPAEKNTHTDNRTPGITLGGLYVTTTPHVTSTRKTRRKKRW